MQVPHTSYADSVASSFTNAAQTSGSIGHFGGYIDMYDGGQLGDGQWRELETCKAVWP